MSRKYKIPIFEYIPDGRNNNYGTDCLYMMPLMSRISDGEPVKGAMRFGELSPYQTGLRHSYYYPGALRWESADWTIEGAIRVGGATYHNDYVVVHVNADIYPIEGHMPTREFIKLIPFFYGGVANARLGVLKQGQRFTFKVV